MWILFIAVFNAIAIVGWVPATVLATFPEGGVIVLAVLLAVAINFALLYITKRVFKCSKRK